MAGIFLRQGSSFVALREQAYEAETVLQELIAEHPQMLGGDDAEHGTLLLIRREAGVSDQEDGGARWSLDHLYVDAAGVPTLVEVKRLYNPDCMLEISGMAVIDLSFSPELRRIIEFLNGQMTDTTVLAIEVKQYVDDAGTQQTIVPRVVGQTQQARQAKGAVRQTNSSWELESVLARLAARDPREAQIARRLIDRLAARSDLWMWFGKGAKDSSAIIGRTGQTKGLLAVYTTGSVEARFKYLMAMAPFDDADRIQAFIDELNTIPGVSFPPGKLGWPNCPLLGLQSDDSLDRFASAFERALDEIAAAQEPSPSPPR